MDRARPGRGLRSWPRGYGLVVAVLVVVVVLLFALVEVAAVPVLTTPSR